MENITQTNQGIMKEILERKDNSAYHFWLVWAVCAILFMAIVIAQQFDSATITQHYSNNTYRGQQPINQKLADLEFTQKLKEQKSQQAFLIKAHASL